MRTFRDLGAGKSHLDHSILAEANRMCEYLEENLCDKPVEINNFFNIIVLNILWKIVGGKR